MTMESYKFGSEIIKLPKIANALAREALLQVDSLRDDVSDERIDNISASFVDAYVRMVKSGKQLQTPDLPFNPFDMSTLPLKSLDADDCIAHFKSGDEYTDSLVDQLNSESLEDAKLRGAAYIVLMISIIAHYEKQLASASKMKKQRALRIIDQHLFWLHKAVSTFQHMPKEAVFLRSKQAKVEAAAKGGAAKASRFTELRDTVIQEALQKYPTETATKAAAQIFEKLSSKGDWLSDEQGKPLLPDPIKTFTRWIRESRRLEVD